MTLDLEAIKARVEKDESELWVLDQDIDYSGHWVVGRGMRIVAFCTRFDDAWQIVQEHRQAARQDIPAVIAEVERLTERVKELEEGIIKHSNGIMDILNKWGKDAQEAKQL